MTYPTEPPRSGMPPWARWTLIGCAGCLTVVILGTIGCMGLSYYFLGRHMKLIDMSDKPDPPPTATAGQLVPPRVDSFTRQSVSRYTVPGTGEASGWTAHYTSGSQRVELTVRPTSTARQSPSPPSPFGGIPRSRNPNLGVHWSMKVGATSMDMVTWAKPNWTFTVQSPDMAAEAFARAYHPGASPAPTPEKVRPHR